MLISWNPPEGRTTMATVLMVPACRSSLPSLPEMATCWPEKNANSFGPLGTVRNGVGEPTAMPVAICVAPVNTLKVNG